MMTENRPEWDDMYRSGDLPWETGRVDANLVDVVSALELEPCNVLEIGCGTGNNALWLDEQGHVVTAVDLSPLAIQAARAKSDGSDIGYYDMNVLEDELPVGPYGFVFDRGCFHSMPDRESKEKYIRIVCDLLDAKGFWLSLIGNADGPELEVGPPRMTAEEIVTLVEPHFEIISLQNSTFDSDQPVDERPRCWVALLKKR